MQVTEEKKKHSVTVQINFDEELKFLEEWLEKPNFIEVCTKKSAAEKQQEGKSVVVPISYQHMECVEDSSGDAKIENFNKIFMFWSLEEIKFYY